ncbi:MAG: DNRLRE domain-containing protein [Muricomes sp.]
MRKRRKRIMKTAISLFMAAVIAGQGTGPIFVYAQDVAENTPRQVEFEHPEAVESVDEVLNEEDVRGTGETPTPLKEDNLPAEEQNVQESTEEGTNQELKEPEDYYPLPEEPEGRLVDFTENSKTYKAESDDKSYITQFGGYMGIYEDENGKLKEVENDLVESQGEETEEVLVNKANDYQVILPKNVTDQAGMVLEKEGKRLEIIPASGDYSKPVIKDNAVLYNQVSDGVDVQYTIIDNNIKEDIILNKKIDISEFKYELVYQDLNIEKKDGIVYLYEEGKSVEDAVYVLEAPIMIDAAGEVSMKIDLSVQKEEGRTYLSVVPDQEWLNKEERQYPVRIDPTTVTVTRDSFSMIGVEQGAPDTWIGDNRYPYVGYDDGIKSGNLENYGQLHMICRTYIKVYSDFSTIPKESKIDNATFSVSQLTNYSGGSSQFGLYRVDSPWGEYATWLEQPANHTFIDVQNAKANAYEYIDYNVKDMVNDWIQGTYPNNGMVLKAIDEANGLDASMQCEVLNNKLSVYGPKLTIQWSPAEDPYLRDMPIEDLSIQVRPMTEKSVAGKLQFDAVFPDGISKSKSTVEYYLSPDEDGKNHHKTEAQGDYKYPDNTEYLKAFPDATKYKSKDSNWQGAVYTGLEFDKLYKFKAAAAKDDKTSGEKESDNFVIYKVKQYDTFPKIAKYYGVPLTDIMKDNHVQDALAIENNTIFIRNPKTNVPYSPEPLTDADKRKIDGALMGRGLHCEFGFEPVNLNTGNFLMEQEDAVLPELNGKFSILRTYNSKGTDQNSLFGRGWSFAYDQGLSKTEDGNIILKRGDGKLPVFVSKWRRKLSCTGRICLRFKRSGL